METIRKFTRLLLVSYVLCLNAPWNHGNSPTTVFLTTDVPIGGSLAAVKELETKLGLDLRNESLETERAVSSKL